MESKLNRAEANITKFLDSIRLKHPEALVVIGALDNDINGLGGIVAIKGCQQGIDMALKNAADESPEMKKAVLRVANYIKAKKKGSLPDDHPLSKLADALDQMSSKKKEKPPIPDDHPLSKLSEAFGVKDEFHKALKEKANAKDWSNKDHLPGEMAQDFVRRMCKEDGIEVDSVKDSIIRIMIPNIPMDKLSKKEGKI